MNEPAWQRRVVRVVRGAEWVALVVGILGVVVALEASPLALGATALGAVWVIAATVTPPRVLGRPWMLDALTVAGVVTTMAAVTLTGATDSAFYLLSLTPAIHAAVVGGYRMGLTAAGLSGMLLLAVTLSAEGALPSDAVGMGVLYLVMAATVAQIRRILVDLDEQARTAEETSTVAVRRLEHIEDANSLLARLADIAATGDLSPVAVGRAALEAIVARYPGSLGVAAIEGENGPIFVARHGTLPPDGHDHVLPLTSGGRRVGFVRLTTPAPLDDDTAEALGASLRPLALAFGNARLLQDVTRNAVTEERTRLARELHDDIGPSLASLGLSLDVALIQGIDQAEVTEHLGLLRHRVGDLVDEVRATVADLRAPAAGTFRTFLDGLLAGPPPLGTVDVDVDERRPVRPSLAPDVYGVVGEAVRNALRHAGASTVRVHGWIDFDRGRLVVEDDGTGFDPGAVPDGHYGLVGMRERATRSGLTLDVSPTSDGTRVTTAWGET